MASFYPVNDAAFSVWLGNFLAVATANRDVLDLKDDDLVTLQALKADLDTCIADAGTAREVAKATTTALDTTRRKANIQLSYRGKVIVANPDIPTPLKEQLGLNVPDAPTRPTSPRTPTQLSVEAFTNGVNRLRWNANDNRPSTQYIVEARFGKEKDFTFINVTTKTCFDHVDQPIGMAQIYRVKARRSDRDSDYSDLAIAYPYNQRDLIHNPESQEQTPQQDNYR